MKLSQEITALYLSSFKDQSLVTRLLTLPANVVRDAASLSIVNSSERKQLEDRLVKQMTPSRSGSTTSRPKRQRTDRFPRFSPARSYATQRVAFLFSLEAVRKTRCPEPYLFKKPHHHS